MTIRYTKKEQNTMPRGLMKSGRYSSHSQSMIQNYNPSGELYMADTKSRGKNIKIFDKIKLQHVQTNFRLHSLEQEWRNGSYNQAVGCHKAKDETDWFTVYKADPDDNNRSNISYHFQYGDRVLLCSVAARKYLHVTDEFPSEVSKNHEVSLCTNGEGAAGCQEDEWELVKTASTYDSYWRVGEIVRLKSVHFDSFLCSHYKKLRESGDNQVFVRNKELADKKKTEAEIFIEEEWIVCEIEPFIYSANLTDKRQSKKTEQYEEIENLRKMRSQIQIKVPQINNNSTIDLLKMANQRLAQLEMQKQKQVQSSKRQSFLSKFFTCALCCPDQNQYKTLD